MKKYKIKPRFFILIVLILILIIAFFLIKNKETANYYPVSSRIDSVNKTKIADAKTIGWIRVQGTDIDYPIIRETNAAYNSGTDYLWEPNNSLDNENRKTIYGHNLLNISSKPLVRDPSHTRFEQLMSFVYENFAKDNLYLQYTSGGKEYIYKIYAVSFLSKEDETGASIKNKTKLQDYIEEAKKVSLYDYNVKVSSNDKLISLITCTRYFGISDKTQFRIDARQVRKNEKVIKYTVETNQNYDIIKTK